MNFNIKSYQSVGPIELTSNKKEIRELFDNNFNESKKSTSNGSTDMFSNFFAYYDENSCIKAVEFFGDAKVTFLDKELLQKNYHSIKKFFSKIDTELDFHDAGFISHKYGIGFYSPFPEEKRSKVESVIVFRKDYYM